MRYVTNLDSAHLTVQTEQTHELWGGGLALAERERLFRERLASAGPERFQSSGLVDEEGRLAASMKRYYFGLVAGGAEGRCVGLGAIFTDPARRGQGLAAELIRAVLADSRDRLRCRYALLFSDIGPEYYRRFGFRETPAWSGQCRVEELPAGPALEARPAGPGELAELLRRHAALTERFPIRCARSGWSWGFFRALNRVEQDLLLEGEGLLSYSVSPGVLRVEELLVPEGASTAAWATVRGLASRAGVTEIRGWQLPGGAPGRARERAIPMIADLCAPGSLRAEDLAAAYFAVPDHY
jgi:predicted N-acetyltransferase YhbS